MYNPTYTFSAAATYRVCLRAITVGGCVKEYCDTVSIPSIATPCNLTVYPNPANTNAYINTYLNQPGTIYAYVYNAQNIMVTYQSQSGVMGNNVINLNVANLVPGTYTVRVYNGSSNQVCTARFEKL